MQVWRLEHIHAQVADGTEPPNQRLHKRVVRITRLERRADKPEFQRIVAAWDSDVMDANLGQTTMVRDVWGAPNWRIDNQENGATRSQGPNSLPYYSIAVQRGGNVYASVLVPRNYRVGRRRIRNALLQSQSRLEVVMLHVDRSQVDQLPRPDEQPSRSSFLFVQGLAWVLLCGISILA